MASIYNKEQMNENLKELGFDSVADFMITMQNMTIAQANEIKQVVRLAKKVNNG